MNGIMFLIENYRMQYHENFARRIECSLCHNRSSEANLIFIFGLVCVYTVKIFKGLVSRVQFNLFQKRLLKVIEIIDHRNMKYSKTHFNLWPEQLWQKTRPQQRQWCFRVVWVNGNLHLWFWHIFTIWSGTHVSFRFFCSCNKSFFSSWNSSTCFWY